MANVTLARAVQLARTPEELADVLQEIGRRYLLARAEEKKYAAVKKEIRDACVAALKRLETTSYEWDVEGARFRATLYEVVRVQVTDALKNYLESVGFGHLVTETVVRHVDEDVLWKLIRCGDVSLDRVRDLAEISVIEGFRITELKRHDDPGTEDA